MSEAKSWCVEAAERGDYCLVEREMVLMKMLSEGMFSRALLVPCLGKYSCMDGHLLQRHQTH